MARRSDHTPEELAALAVDKALEIIDEKGPEGFSARGVAALMGYTVGTLYHVFGDLDGLRLRLNARILDAWHAELVKSLGRTAEDPLRHLAGAYIGFARRRRNRWLALFEQRTGKPAPLPPWYAEKMARLFALVEAALPPEDPHRARSAKVLWAGLHGICVLSLSGKLDAVGSDKPEVLADALLESYLRGIR